MGNENENSLPLCQLSNIQKMVDKLYAGKRRENHHISVLGPTNPFILTSEKSKKKVDVPDTPQAPVGFWMDTLCVPVNDEKLRKMTISRMRTIYTEAHRVLVLDSRVRSFSRTASQNERGSSLFLSNWQSRLWTFHEGLLARNLFFQFEDGPISLAKMERDAQKEKRSNGGQLSNFFGTRLFSKIPMFDFKVCVVEPKRMTATGERLLHYVRPLRFRSTTHKSDETLCLATLLDLNPNPLFLIRKRPVEEEEEQAEKQRVCDERMASFVCMIGEFPPAVIFNSLQGCRSGVFNGLQGHIWATRIVLICIKA